MLIVPGYSFTDNLTDDGTAEHFGQFCASCIITGFAMSHFDASAHIVQVSATEPVSDQGEGSLWFDTTLGLFRVKDGSRWDCPYIGPELTNSTGSAIRQGAVVTVISADHIEPAPINTRGGHLGILMATCADGDSAILAGSGLVSILVHGPTGPGSLLVVDDTTGFEGYARGATFIYGGPTLITGGLCLGMALGNIANTTGLVTCMGWS